MKNEVYSKVFMWLFVGLALTFGTGYCITFNAQLYNMLTGTMAWLILFIIEIGIAIFFSTRLMKMSKTTAMICYLLFSFISGLTFSSIFIEYKMTSIISVFAITSILFLIFGLYGMFTKRDLSKYGTFLMMAFFGLLAAIILGIFIQSSAFHICIEIGIIIIFLGYIAYDMHIIKELSNSIEEDKLALFGAFNLYLDFINIFISLLELLGQADDYR